MVSELPCSSRLRFDTPDWHLPPVELVVLVHSHPDPAPILHPAKTYVNAGIKSGTGKSVGNSNGDGTKADVGAGTSTKNSNSRRNGRSNGSSSRTGHIKSSNDSKSWYQ